MTIPEFLYRDFSKEEHVIEFIEKGKFRLSLLQSYKEIEDKCRRDESEGKSESIVKKCLPGLTLRLKGTSGDSLYLFCTSGPNVDLDYMKGKWPYIVKITDPEKLKKSLCDIKPINTKMEIIGNGMCLSVRRSARREADVANFYTMLGI